MNTRSNVVRSFIRGLVKGFMVTSSIIAMSYLAAAIIIGAINM